MKLHTITNRQETRITLPGCEPRVFAGSEDNVLMDASVYANQSKHAIIEVRHVIEMRIEENWQMKS